MLCPPPGILPFEVCFLVHSTSLFTSPLQNQKRSIWQLMPFFSTVRFSCPYFCPDLKHVLTDRRSEPVCWQWRSKWRRPRRTTQQAYADIEDTPEPPLAMSMMMMIMMMMMWWWWWWWWRGRIADLLSCRPWQVRVSCCCQTNTFNLIFYYYFFRIYLWLYTLCSLYLYACQVRVTVGDSGLCCCACVTYFER